MNILSLLCVKQRLDFGQNLCLIYRSGAALPRPPDGHVGRGILLGGALPDLVDRGDRDTVVVSVHRPDGAAVRRKSGGVAGTLPYPHVRPGAVGPQGKDGCKLFLCQLL